MKGVLGLVLLALGIVVAAASGARNGERHVQYRQAAAAVHAAEEADAVVQAGKRLNETLKKEGIDVSPPTLDEALKLLETEPRLKAQVEATQAAIEKLGKWEMGDGPPAEQLHLAERRRNAIGLPEPRERLAQWFSVGGVGWAVGLGLIVAGALLARRQIAEENSGTGTSAVARVDFGGTMQAALAEVDRIAAEIAELGMDADAPAARAALDALVDERLTPLVEGRGQLIARHGLAGFAEYFGPFSGAERNVNRAWSALTDGHPPVARESLALARIGFAAAAEAWAAVDGRGGQA